MGSRCFYYFLSPPLSLCPSLIKTASCASVDDLIFIHESKERKMERGKGKGERGKGKGERGKGKGGIKKKVVGSWKLEVGSGKWEVGSGKYSFDCVIS